MKVLFVAPYIGHIYGGPSKVLLELAQGLSSFNIAVDIVTTSANGSNNLEVPLNIWITQKGYRIRYFPNWHINDFIFSPYLTYWLFNYVGKYDIVHTHTIFAPLISLVHWICQLHKIPYIMTPHGMLEPWALSYKAWKKKFYYKLLEKPALHQANAIQVLSTTEAQHVNSLGFQHTLVAPNGIHRQEFESLPNPEIFYQQFPSTYNKTLILFLGRIDPKKGLDLLAPAFAKVHNQFPQTRLVVAGPDSIAFLPTVHNYFAQAGCLDVVTFADMLTGSLKLAAMAAASFYVSPSYSEGFSMSVLEGMASGLPCVITTGCNFPEAATAKAAHVVDINADAIADALIQCLSHPQQAKSMGDRARQFIFQNYTWEQTAERLMQLYATIVNKEPLPECVI